jgi:hypothetical protein
MTALAPARIGDHIGRMTTLSDAVRRAIRDAPCSLRSLARAASVPHSTLVHITKREREATPAVAEAVAQALDQWSTRCKQAAHRIRQAKRKGV